MANEITLSMNVSCTVGGQTCSLTKNKSYNCATGNQVSGTVSIATSSTAIPIGGVTVGTQQFMALINNDATNYVDIAIDNANANNFTRLLPGDFCFIKPEASVTYYGKAHTGAIELGYVVLDV